MGLLLLIRAGRAGVGLTGRPKEVESLQPELPPQQRPGGSYKERRRFSVKRYIAHHDDWCWVAKDGISTIFAL